MALQDTLLVHMQTSMEEKMENNLTSMLSDFQLLAEASFHTLSLDFY